MSCAEGKAGAPDNIIYIYIYIMIFHMYMYIWDAPAKAELADELAREEGRRALPWPASQVVFRVGDRLGLSMCILCYYMIL